MAKDPKHALSVRLSNEEFDILLRESNRLGISMNTLICFCVVNCAPQIKVTVEEIPITVKRLIEVETVELKKTLSL